MSTQVTERGNARCPSSSEFPIGSELLGYRIERVLGRGGMGIVYLAEDLRLKRPVALKVLSAELAADERFRLRLRTESELAASLDHPRARRGPRIATKAPSTQTQESPTQAPSVAG